MIEYLNAIATGLLLFIAVSLLKRERLDLQSVTNGIDFLNNALDFIGNLPHWIHFYNNLTANIQKLCEENDRLQERLNDLKHRVENEEYRTARRRKSEVDNWLSSAKSKCTEVHAFLQDMESETNRVSKFLHRAWLGNQVERKIREVGELNSSGMFEEVLSCIKERVEMVTTPLVGVAAAENIRKINTWLENGVTKIGVYGIKGIGKTALMNHIHNQLVTRDFSAHVIMITVGEDHNEYDLQGAIARELDINLEEAKGPRRTALLNRALRQRSFVLILDGLSKYISEERIGIPLGPATGKMIITSRSYDTCRKTGCCNHIIAMDPLRIDEAFELFKQKVGVELESPLGEVARKIVKQCQGVPLKLVDKAIHLRGVDEISIWKGSLDDMLGD